MKRITKSPYRLYTLLFFLTSLGVFFWFLLSGTTFINKADTQAQHIKAIAYYSRYLRNGLKGLLSGHFSGAFPQWDFSIGSGWDVLQTFHYYCIGDPLNLIFALSPTRLLPHFYDFVQLLRIYLSGLFFIPLVHELRGRGSVCSEAAGALMYAFGFWSLERVNGHPFFYTAMLYLPLLILGIERIFKKKSPTVFILAVFLSAVSNFYYFYMHGIMTAGYVLIRLGAEYCFERKAYRKNLHADTAAIDESASLGKKVTLISKMPILIKTALYAAVGMAMSAVILLPQLYFFRLNPRLGMDTRNPLLFNLGYYLRLPGDLMSNELNCYGTVPPFLIALLLLFRRKNRDNEKPSLQDLVLKLCFGASAFMLLFPIFGSIFAGFSHSVDRWTFLLSLIAPIIVVARWDEFNPLSKELKDYAFIGITVYFAICLLFKESRTPFTMISIAMSFIIIILSSSEGKFFSKWREPLLLFIIIINICLSGMYRYAPLMTRAAEQMNTAEEIVDKIIFNETQTIEEMAAADNQTGLYRYGGLPSKNPGPLSGLSSTAFYWSTHNPYHALFEEKLGMRNLYSLAADNYDERAVATAVSAVRYYLKKPNSNDIPYGFSLTCQKNVTSKLTENAMAELRRELGREELNDLEMASVKNATVSNRNFYTNDYALPMGFTYDSFIKETEVESLSFSGREALMLNTGILSIDDLQVKTVADTGISESSIEAAAADITRLPFTIECDSENITETDGGFLTTAPNASATLHLNERDPYKVSELFLEINGISYDYTDKYELYFGNDDIFDPLHLYSETAFKLLHDDERAEIKELHFKENVKEAKNATLTISDSLGREKNVEYMTPYEKKYSGRNEAAVNLGYSEDKADSIKITFSNPGRYTFKELSVYSHSLENFPERVASLTEDTLDNEYIGTDFVSGTVSIKVPKLLFLSIPYSPGWEARVDGKPAFLYRANYMYMALPLNAGEHSIELYYHTPYLRLGALLSLFGFLLFLGIWLYFRKRTGQEKA